MRQTVHSKIDAEAVLRGVAGVGPGLMRVCIEYLFDLTREREQDLVVQLLVSFTKQGAVSSDDLLTALQALTRQLEDLRCAHSLACHT